MLLLLQEVVSHQHGSSVVLAIVRQQLPVPVPILADEKLCLPQAIVIQVLRAALVAALVVVGVGANVVDIGATHSDR